MSLALISLSDLGDLLWRNALFAIPLAVVAAAICRWIPCRPSTRHALWCIVLASLLAPPVIPHLDLSEALPDLPSARTPSGDANQPAIQSRVASDHSTSAPNPPPVDESIHSIKIGSPQLSASLPTTLRTPARTSEPVEQVLAAPLAEMQLDVPRTIDEKSRTIESSSGDSSFDLPTACGDFGSPTTSPPQTFPNNVSAESPQVFSDYQVQSVTGPANSAGNVRSGLSQWGVQLLAMRNALVALPPIPTAVWLCGSALVLLVLIVRMIRFQSILHSAQSAPDDVVHMVRREARQIGVMFPPAVYFTNRRVSPLVWCGRRRALLLPRGLWSELDELGRRAVVLHELAHLKRRDHWICWADLLIACVYWWHPIAWWVRLRVRDEADACCDAWVTALLPSSRSAYAKALLATRQYVNESHRAMPVVGLGACAQKTKRFARRLTMVMTDKPKPRLSMLGAALVTCMAAAGWLAAPLLACPPEDRETTAKAALKAELKAKEKAKAQAITVAPMKKRAPDAQSGMSTYEEYRESRDQQPRPHDDDLRGRIDQLERRLDRITEKLEQMIEGPRSQMSIPGTPQPALAPSQPRTLRGAVLAAPPTPPAPPVPPAPSAQGAPRIGRLLSMAGHAMEDSDETVVRLYRLPAGKREDFTKFMSRQDVPVLVSPAPDGINVHATPRQHEIVKGFIDLIHPEGRQAPAGAGAQGEGIGFGGVAIAGISPTEFDRLTKLAAEYEAVAAQARARGDMKAAHDAAQTLRLRRQGMNEHMRSIHQRASELRRKAVELQRQSEQLESKAESLNGADRFQMLTQAEAIAAQAAALEEQAEVEAEQAEAMLEVIEAAQTEVEDAIDEIEEIAEAEAESEAEAADEAENADSKNDD